MHMLLILLVLCLRKPHGISHLAASGKFESERFCADNEDHHVV
jgi:hypothetical protein